jgi:acyl dehydratase
MNRDDQKTLVDRGIEKYHKKMVGKALQPELGWEEATRDAIRLFSNGLGDRNPLWLDQEYAQNSMHKGLLAPPAFLNGVSEGQAIVGLPGLIATFVGSEWTWRRHIRKGDRFRVSNLLRDLEEKSPKNGKRRFLQQGTISYENQFNEPVGECTWKLFRTEAKPGGEEKPKGSAGSQEIQPHKYTKEELEKIFSTIDAEVIRGDRPRYFEDVDTGEELPPVVKGPLALSDMVAWAMGTAWHRMGMAHETKLAFLREHPGLAYTDPKTETPEPIANSHFQSAAAQILMGSSLPFDLGFQRIAWMTHPVTNWMSDCGFLRYLKGDIVSFVRFGDTTWCKGKIIGKRIQNEERLVNIRLYCENQKGETTATGEAVVLLPSRAN